MLQPLAVEIIWSTILVIKNYDGEDLSSFRQKLATYGTIKIKTVDGVDTLKINVDANDMECEFQASLELLMEFVSEAIRVWTLMLDLCLTVICQSIKRISSTIAKIALVLLAKKLL